MKKLELSDTSSEIIVVLPVQNSYTCYLFIVMRKRKKKLFSYDFLKSTYIATYVSSSCKSRHLTFRMNSLKVKVDLGDT